MRQKLIYADGRSRGAVWRTRFVALALILAVLHFTSHFEEAQPALCQLQIWAAENLDIKGSVDYCPKPVAVKSTTRGR